MRLLGLSDLRDFATIIDILNQTGVYADNAKKFLTRELGFDALLATQYPYLPFRYQPEHLGINWPQVTESWEINAPKTAVIYNTDNIQSFQAEVINSKCREGQYSNSRDF